jgi:predicted GNAT superfamily acetyltransferase
MPIRLYRRSDLQALFEINQQSTPGVGHEDSAAGLARWIDISTCLVAVNETDNPLGFITLIPPGTMAYDSNNLRWFERYQDGRDTSLIYVDRIALAPEARGQRIGQTLYEAAFATFKTTDEIGCEVNTAPPNPGSHRFHQRLGFRKIGTRAHGDDYAVAYYTRKITT